MIDATTVERLKQLPEWQELEAHIRNERARLDSVSGLLHIRHDEGLATETLARMRAIEIIDAILEPFGFSIAQAPDRHGHTKDKTGL